MELFDIDAKFGDVVEDYSKLLKHCKFAEHLKRLKIEHI